VYQGGVEDIALEPAVLDTTLGTARRSAELGAGQRGHARHGRTGEGVDIAVAPLRHGTRAIGLLAAQSGTLDIGTLDAVAGVVAIAIERAQFLSEREAAELTRQKADLASTLLASLSHDLRTPLTAIRVAVENLGGPLAAGERRAQANAAATELDRLTRLVRDILAMARIDAAAITIDREWVSAADVVDAAIAHVRLAVEGRALHVDADTSRQVQIDPRLVSSALSHLLENAAQYAPPDQSIDVRAMIEADGLHVAVTDHGPGLDAGEIDHLFERFYRGRAARETTSGTGMGLAITRGLLVAAGGRVWAENVRTGGARFLVVIPAAVRATPISEVT
jgi:two-component system sensor histidine kinase KdpD